MIENDGVMKILARKAFLTFLRCYQKHPMKEIFNIKTLNLKATAMAFGLKKQPDVDFCILLPENAELWEGYEFIMKDLPNKCVGE